MPLIHIETFIAAPIQRAFDLMRDAETHVRTTAQTRERSVSGRTTGLFELGDEVTWEAVHFGIRQRLTVRITRCEPPHVFEDQMVRGAFAHFTHVHAFRENGGGTVMVDDFNYAAPFGFVGALAERIILTRYMRRFLEQRANALKEIAEGD